MFQALLSGKPAQLYDVNNPDWLPTLHLGHSKIATEAPVSLAKERYERSVSRNRDLAARREADAVEVATREKATCQEREEAVGVTNAAKALLLLSDVPFGVS